MGVFVTWFAILIFRFSHIRMVEYIRHPQSPKMKKELPRYMQPPATSHLLRTRSPPSQVTAMYLLLPPSRSHGDRALRSRQLARSRKVPARYILYSVNQVFR